MKDPALFCCILVLCIWLAAGNYYLGYWTGYQRAQTNCVEHPENFALSAIAFCRGKKLK